MSKRKSNRCRPEASQEESVWNDHWEHKGSLRVKVITRMGAPSVRVIQIEDIPDWANALVLKGQEAISMESLDPIKKNEQFFFQGKHWQVLGFRSEQQIIIMIYRFIAVPIH